MAFMIPDIQEFSTSEAAEYAPREDGEPSEAGWYARLSAPGYMDCTEWSGPFASEEEALADLVETFGLCERCKEEDAPESPLCDDCVSELGIPEGWSVSAWSDLTNHRAITCNACAYTVEYHALGEVIPDAAREKMRLPSHTLTLTPEEESALSWISARYESARVLYDGMIRQECSDIDCHLHPHTFAIPERVAWSYQDALEEEDGNQVVPPCAGGTLAEKLLTFLEAIV